MNVVVDREGRRRRARGERAARRPWVVALVPVLLAGLPACKPSVPSQPTWHDDIFPLMQARCIRCHDDPPRSDPTTPTPSLPPAAYSFNFPFLSDPPQPGAATLRSLGPEAIRGQPPAAGAAPFRRMPPPPAEPLSDWEIELIDNWSKESPPR